MIELSRLLGFDVSFSNEEMIENAEMAYADHVSKEIQKKIEGYSVDEVSLVIDLLNTQWTTSATALVDDGTIDVSHSGKPNFVDVRSLEKNKGVRYDLSSKDVIIVFEDSNEIIYPTLFYDVVERSTILHYTSEPFKTKERGRMLILAKTG